MSHPCKGRGKRPVDVAALRRRKILTQKFKEALQNNDKSQFEEALIHILGLLPGTSEYAEAMKAWRDHHGRS
jgi:hypothetical protein